MSHPSNQTILFQGDSITDAGRSREQLHPNSGHGLGFGYAGQVASGMLARCPQADLKFLNRGVSGNRVTDLLCRWRPDAIHLKPDWISILIGVNDTWHRAKSDCGTTVELYERLYRLLLQETRKELPGVRFVLCEPFALPVGGFEAAWMDELRERSQVVQRLAGEFDAVYVPFQSLFDEATREAPATYWLPDGVHPSPAGHRRMAELWLRSVGW